MRIEGLRVCRVCRVCYAVLLSCDSSLEEALSAIVIISRSTWLRRLDTSPNSFAKQLV